MLSFLFSWLCCVVLKHRLVCPWPIACPYIWLGTDLHNVHVPSVTVISYEVTVTTGDMLAAGTNANVFCQIYGDDGKTLVLALGNRSNNFERGTIEIFKVKRSSSLLLMGGDKNWRGRVTHCFLFRYGDILPCKLITRVDEALGRGF